MVVPTQTPQVIRFGEFELDLLAEELRKGGVRVKIQEQPAQVLLALVSRHGELVSRDDLRRQLWAADTFVDFETGLNRSIAKLREVLGDSPEAPRYIKTIPRQGYRFIAPVEPIPFALESQSTDVGSTDHTYKLLKAVTGQTKGRRVRKNRTCRPGAGVIRR